MTLRNDESDIIFGPDFTLEDILNAPKSPNQEPTAKDPNSQISAFGTCYFSYDNAGAAFAAVKGWQAWLQRVTGRDVYSVFTSTDTLLDCDNSGFMLVWIQKDAIEDYPVYKAEIDRWCFGPARMAVMSLEECHAAMIALLTMSGFTPEDAEDAYQDCIKGGDTS